MTSYNPTIGIFTEGTATSSFLPTLREFFQPRALYKLNAVDLKNRKLMQGLDLLVLPGVSSEDSPYHSLLNSAAMSAIFSGLKRGLSVWGSCAGAYQMAAQILYDTPYKPDMKVPGVGVFSGEAYGPVDGQAPEIDDRDRFSEVRVLRVSFNDPAGKERITGVCYGNGPGYRPAHGEKLDIMARYMDVKDNPVAVVGKEVSNGYVLLTGVLPEIALNHMPPAMNIEEKFSHVARLRAEFAPHEEGRQMLMQTIAQKFQSRWESIVPLSIMNNSR